MRWHEVYAQSAPAPLEEIAGTVYFRRGVAATDNGFRYLEAAAPAGLDAEREALEDVLRDVDLGAKDLIQALLPVASAEEKILAYDKLLEAKLTSECLARGYTKREPSDYLDSKVVRYRQDARDYTAHRDEAMLTGEDMLNAYLTTGQIPSVSAFLAALPDITWTIDPGNVNPSEGMFIEKAEG